VTGSPGRRGARVPLRPSPGFTLVEVLLVLALVGIVAAVGIAPVVHTVGLLTGVEDGFAEDTAFRLAASRLAADFQHRLPVPQGPAFRLVRRDKFGGNANDVVVAWSGASRTGNRPQGSVLYRVIWPDDAASEIMPGLYRWFLGGVLPQQVDPDQISFDRGQLVLPDVSALRIQVHDGAAWVGQYEGEFPLGMEIHLERQERALTYVDWFPR